MTTHPPPLFTPPNLWRTVSVHGQPPANTLIDFVWENGTSTTVGRLTGAEPAYGKHIKWRLSDLPPLDAVQPAPAPERPEPKFKVGDRVTHRNFAEPQEIRSCVWDGVKWTHEFVGRDGWWHEANLTAAPEPSIPIGGWFDPGDGRTLQRVANPYDGDDGMEAAAARIWHRTTHSWSSAAPTRCSPLTEREAMERLYPVGTWLRDKRDGKTYEVLAWRTEDNPCGDRPYDSNYPWRLRRHPGNYTSNFDLNIARNATVLPGPPLPAPWRPLDELPEDGVQVLALRTSGGYSLEWAEHVRISSSFEAWADLDDVAPIPAHLRSTP